EMSRMGYCSAGFSRQYGFPISFANLTDPPGHSWAVPSVLSAMGLRYLAVASNQWRGPIILHGRMNEKSPFWWEGPDGSKVLTWYSRHYHQAPNLFGQAPVLQAGIDSLPVFLQPYDRSQYVPDAVMLFGTGGDNEPFATDARQLSFVETWNKEFAFP